MSERPIPVPDELSAPFWLAAAAHSLVLARCSQCRARSHPPDVACPHCGDTDPQFQFEPATPAGEVCSWTTLHQSFVPGFDDLLPMVLVDVRIDGADDVRLIGRLLDAADHPIQIGDRVRVEFEDLEPGVSVPAFRMDP